MIESTVGESSWVCRSLPRTQNASLSVQISVLCYVAVTRKFNVRTIKKCGVPPACQIEHLRARLKSWPFRSVSCRPQDNSKRRSSVLEVMGLTRLLGSTRAPVVGVLTAMALLAAFAISAPPAAGASSANAAPLDVLQVRPVLSMSRSHCHASRPQETPNPRRHITLGWPCATLGPVAVSVPVIEHVYEGFSEAGLQVVTVKIRPGEAAALRSLGRRHPSETYALVLLDRILSTPTGSLLNVGTRLQVAGGWSTSSPISREIARVMRAPLTVTGPRTALSSCSSGQLVATGGRQGGGFRTAHADVELKSMSSAGCRLGAPTSVSLLTADGATLPVDYRSPAVGRPAVLHRGSVADLALSWANWCAPDPGPLTIRLAWSDGEGPVDGSFNGPPAYDYVPGCVDRERPSTLLDLGYHVVNAESSP